MGDTNQPITTSDTQPPESTRNFHHCLLLGAPSLLGSWLHSSSSSLWAAPSQPPLLVWPHCPGSLQMQSKTPKSAQTPQRPSDSHLGASFQFLPETFTSDPVYRDQALGPQQTHSSPAFPGQCVAPPSFQLCRTRAASPSCLLSHITPNPLSGPPLSG